VRHTAPPGDNAGHDFPAEQTFALGREGSYHPATRSRLPVSRAIAGGFVVSTDPGPDREAVPAPVGDQADALQAVAAVMRISASRLGSDDPWGRLLTNWSTVLQLQVRLGEARSSGRASPPALRLLPPDLG
jgi:hypothetical protein